MIATTFRSEPVYLLHFRPNWATPPDVRFTEISDVAPGLTGIESREALAATMQVRFNFNLLLHAQESSDFRVGLQRQSAANRRILCPFWPGAVNYYSGGAVYTSPSGEFYTSIGTGAVYTSSTGEGCWLPTGVWLTFEPDFSAWEIHETDTPAGFTPSTSAIRVPLMLGIFEEPPDPILDTSTLITCPIAFRETSTADIALRSVELAFDDGPTVASRTPKLFPLAPDWSNDAQAGAAVVEIEREQIGFARGPVDIYYPQPSRRPLGMGFTMGSWEEVARLIAFFFQRQGMVESFWIQGLCDEISLTAPSSGASVTLSVARAASLGDTRYIVLESPGQPSALRRVTAVNLGTNQLTLDSAPGVFTPERTRITALILARFARPDLTVRFLTDRVAECSLRVIETPNEYFLPSGETPGTTSGALPRKAYLYRFRQDFPEGPRYWRFTSYERDLTAFGENYLPRSIEHTSSSEDVDMEKSKMSLRSRAFDGNPLLLFLPFRMEVPLVCEVFKCSPNTSGVAGVPLLIFSGQVSRPRFDGPLIDFELISAFQDLAQPVPTMLHQPGCNYLLFSQPCGLLETNWTFTASVVSVSGNTVTLNSLARVIGSVPTITLDWFAPGRLWFGAGSAYASRTVYKSTVPFSGSFVVTLSHPFDVAPSGTVKLAPGCDGGFFTCHGKFANRQRFGGFFHAPPGNPSLATIRSEPPQGGKK